MNVVTRRNFARAAGIATAVTHGLWSFVRTYIVRGGFLDGREGFMLAVSNAEGAYYKYVKLMRLAGADARASSRTK